MPAASASLHRAHLLGLKQAAREAELEANKNAVAQVGSSQLQIGPSTELCSQVP
jgi:hypothetical protein